ncbi:hypothetical protein H6P81_016837 [Aristolochia fimbriata]|uniref:Bms1-type G domain-containing protein n=1 Tax=Aristolochia fimbriata TaxID=158543 RepID=A0AAV7DXB7_ARIFI|nr:hypothetical protein H6P81_016837 [Aristolochia fimbriata]
MVGSRVQVNKAHKSRYASKSSRDIHRTSGADKTRIAKSNNVIKGSRAARMKWSKMMGDQQRAAVLKEKRATGGSSSPPRVIVLFGLSASVNVKALAQDILTVLSPEGAVQKFNTVASPNYKFRTTVLEAPYGDLLSCTEMAKVADLIAFVASPSAIHGDDYIDDFGNRCLSVFRALGLPSTAVLMRDLPADTKKRHDLRRSCTLSLASLFPEDCKFYPVDTKDELHKFIWFFKEQRLSVPHWRSQRPYVMAHEVHLVAGDSGEGNCMLLLSGYVRARGLSVNQLVHVSGAGDFQLSKIDVLRNPFPINIRKNQDLMDAEAALEAQILHSLLPDPSKQEPLIVENVPDPLAGEQTWPTEEEMAESAKMNKEKSLRKKTLPRGTSVYQAAWIVEGTDDEESESYDDTGDGMVLEGQDEPFGEEEASGSEHDEYQMGETDRETEGDTLMADGEALPREQIEDEIQKLKIAHAEDEEFPDEVETPIDVPAHKRFAKYRGLKSFRTSSWDPKESLPFDYARTFAFDNFSRTQKHVLAKALEVDQGIEHECVAAGSYVRLHIKKVPLDVASKLCGASRNLPVLACGLLQHESRMSVLHFSIKKHDSYETPIKSKEDLIFNVGFRRFCVRPIFSTDNINSDKHKMERFLHAGRFSIASVYAPISFPPLPLIVLKSEHGDAHAPAIAAFGYLRSVDPDRIMLKKIILTGYPQRVSKLKATVRFMFHNPEDVRWFKPVEVWTKCGRRGRVKEPVGTHGAMKCVFNGGVQQHDTVCMSLYKRSYPKWPDHLCVY